MSMRLERPKIGIRWRPTMALLVVGVLLAGPRVTPVVRGNRVYTLGTMGHLLCLDAASGKVIWSKHLLTDYQVNVPMWGFAASPLLDGNRLVCLVGGEGSVAVAFNKDTGAE